MLRRYVICLVAALIATQAHPHTLNWDAFAPRRAFAATWWDAAATGTHPGATSDASNAPDSTYSSTGDDYTTHSLSVQEEIALNLLNQDRISAGLSPLRHDPALSRIARMKSEDMLNGNYFAHRSPVWGSAREMLTRLGYRFTACGENIARHATLAKAQAAFMTSDGHRRNILSRNWERVGVGVALDANGYPYVTQLFAR